MKPLRGLSREAAWKYGEFGIVSRVVEDADPYELRYKNTAPVGNAVLSVPKEYSGFNGGLWASRPTMDYLSYPFCINTFFLLNFKPVFLCSVDLSKIRNITWFWAFFRRIYAVILTFQQNKCRFSITADRNFSNDAMLNQKNAIVCKREFYYSYIEIYWSLKNGFYPPFSARRFFPHPPCSFTI